LEFSNKKQSQSILPVQKTDTTDRANWISKYQNTIQNKNIYKQKKTKIII